MRKKKSIHFHLFDDSVQALRSVIYVNLLLAFTLFWFPGEGGLINGRFVFCLISALGMWQLIRSYNWRSDNANWMVLAGYVVICFLEVTLLGFPDYIAGNFEGGSISKGVLLDLFIFSLPYLYFMTRVFLISPLVEVIYRNKKLNSLSQAKI